MYCLGNKLTTDYIILRGKNERCLQQQESLLLQLQLINEYKSKIEIELKSIKEQTSKELFKVMTKLKEAYGERDNFRNKYTLCSEKKEILHDIHNTSPTNIDNASYVNNIKKKLLQYEKRIDDNLEITNTLNGTLIQTQNLLQKCITDLKKSKTENNNLKINEVPKDERDYVKENGVHFKRYQPKNKNLQFERSEGNINMIEKILSPKELVNEINKKNAIKTIDNVNNKGKENFDINKQNIIEDDLQPNENEVDYKEMGEH